MNINIIDLSNCSWNERNGTYGGMAGSKEGITYNNEYWLVKYPKSTKDMRVDDISYTTSPLSEYIGSHIYEILGYNVHETILAYRSDKIVVACKDFCKKEGSLREIRTLKNVYNKELEEILDNSLHSTSSSHSVDLDELLIHLNKNPILANIEGIKERFWECVVIDGFINNNDRNNGNWGLIYENGEYNLAPIFDNGAAFYNKISDSKIANRLTDIEKLESSATGIETIYSRNGHKFRYKHILELDNAELKEAIQKVVPKIKTHFEEIKDLIYSIPEEYKGKTIISPIRKEFYIKGMELRLEKLLIPALNRAMENRSLLKKAAPTNRKKEYER